MMGAILAKNVPLKGKEEVEIEVLSTMPTFSKNSTPNKLLDPRSPNPFRTPIIDLQFKDAKPLTKMQDLTTEDNITTSTTTTPTKLKTKLLRDLGYSLDPRSPALNFDRTPLNFNDPDMTDDFSLTGLSLNDSEIQTPIKEHHIESFHTPSVEIVKLAEAEIDPRSPSIDIERTPLNLHILVDEITEDVDSKSDVVPEEADTPIIETTDADQLIETIETVKNVIYMDENRDHLITPNKRTEKTGEKIRTPLSCLINTQERRGNMMQNKTKLARSIFKDSALSANQSAGKMLTSSSKIPVFRRSSSKESN